MDKNGNNIIDNAAEMTEGYWMLNLATSKTIGNKLRVQIGAENLLDLYQSRSAEQYPRSELTLSTSI